MHGNGVPSNVVDVASGPVVADHGKRLERIERIAWAAVLGALVAVAGLVFTAAGWGREVGRLEQTVLHLRERVDEMRSRFQLTLQPNKEPSP